MSAAALPRAAKSSWLAAGTRLETLSLRIADVTPTLMVFGPAAALLYLLTASAGLRWAPGA